MNTDANGGVKLPTIENTTSPEIQPEPETQPEVVHVPQPTVARRPGDNRTTDIARRKKLLAIYRAEPKRIISVSPAYADYVGKIMAIVLNGIYVSVRADGTNHEVPASFADMWDERRIKFDYLIQKAKKMADVKSNLEENPGERLL